MQRNYTIACDVEGTLIDRNGNLDVRVLPLFEKADLDRTRFIFATGGSARVARFALDEINKNLERPIKAYISANCGSQIYSPDGRLIQNKTIAPHDVLNIAKSMRKVDSESLIFYVVGNKYYLENQDDVFIENQIRATKNSFIIYKLKKEERQKGEASGVEFLSCPKQFRLADISQLQQEAQDGINAIYIVPTCYTTTRKDQIAESVKTAARDYPNYDGRMLSVFAASKEEALSEILNIEYNNPKYVDDISQVVFLGDGINDLELLSMCNLSVARGERARERAKRTAKFRINDLEQFATNLYEKGKYDRIIYGEERELDIVANSSEMCQN